MNTPQDVLSAALTYKYLGWSCLPILAGSKKPALRTWKPFQSSAADEQQLREWFDRRDDLGIAVVLGAASNGLTCRDFDREPAYQDWRRQNRNLARTLPTVRTSRGLHVYFRSDLAKTLVFADGELRTNRSYTVLPPSIHPSGKAYKWLTEPTAENVLELDVQKVFGAVEASVSAPDTLCHFDTESVSSVSSVLCVSEGTIPTGIGQRVRRLFELARRLRSHPHYTTTTLAELRPLIMEWHRRALPFIGTKAFDETWGDFGDAWHNVNPLKCGDSVVAAMHRADSASLPPEALQYDSVMTRRLVGLCRELSSSSADGVFFLSCRTGARLLGRSLHKSVARMLRMLVRDGVLTEITKGSPQTCKASRYRWRGG